jgi:hypothetical protein
MNTAGLPTPRSAGTIAGTIDLILLVSAGFTIGAALLVAVYNAFGMAALWVAVGLLYPICLALERRGAGYFDPSGVFGGGGPALPAPGKRVLPAPRPRQITMSRRPTLPEPN